MSQSSSLPSGFQHWHAPSCSACGADLTQHAAVALHLIVGGRRVALETHLEADGLLVDVDGLVAAGRHARSACAACDETLDDEEPATTPEPTPEPTRATDAEWVSPLSDGVNPDLDADFSVARYDFTGCLWETRVPGRDTEETWDSGRHEHARLSAAVRQVIPAPWIERLGLDDAARLALELGLVLHTGSGIERGVLGDDPRDGFDATYRPLSALPAA